MNYADKAKKYLVKAIPTINENNIVTQWELELSYTYPHPDDVDNTDTILIKNFSEVVDVSSLDKKLSKYRNADIINLMNISQFDNEFNSEYQLI